MKANYINLIRFLFDNLIVGFLFQILMNKSRYDKEYVSKKRLQTLSYCGIDKILNVRSSQTSAYFYVLKRQRLPQYILV